MDVATNSAPTKVEANGGSEKPTKKNKEEKSRRKDDKSVEQVMKALNVLETTEEKLAAMCKKYTEIVDENRKLQLSAKQWEKGLHAVLREKEQLQTDHSKAVLTRSRLESLCRELQRQNKQIKEESLLKIREEEEKRKEVSAKFNATLAEITALMTSSNEKTNMLRDENVEITKKFKSICDQNAIQQQQVDKMNTQRQLESELTEARLAKQRLEFAAEKEILLKEKQELYMDIHTLHARVNELEASEASLKGQVSLYADRYDEFQTALTKSNEVFGGFKGEMEKMSKKITRLEKETSTWKSRWEKSHQAFLEVVAEKSKCESELALASRKHVQLEKLCRTLQTERVILLAQIKGMNMSPAAGDAGDDAINTAFGTPDESSTDQQTTCTAAQKPATTSEQDSEIMATLESLSLQSPDTSDVVTALGNTPDVINIAPTPSDSTVVNKIINAEKPSQESNGDSANTQDEANVLAVDKAPTDYGSVGGEKLSSTGKPEMDKQGAKVDTRTANKKGVKPRPGAKETQGDKKMKAPSAVDIKKASCDATKEKKDKDNVKVLTGNKNKTEGPTDKKVKGEESDKKDESTKEKKDIDSSNEKQKLVSESTLDSNKITELANDAKKDVCEVKEKSNGDSLTEKKVTESVASNGSTNTIAVLNEVNIEKAAAGDVKIVQESVLIVAPPVTGTKGSEPSSDATEQVAKDFQKGDKSVGDNCKGCAETQQGNETKVKDAAKKPVECSVKEGNAKTTAAVEKAVEKSPGVQPADKKKSVVNEGNQAIASTENKANKDECKPKHGSKDSEKKVEVTPSLSATNDLDSSTADKVQATSEAITSVVGKDAQASLNKSSPAPGKDVKRPKRPERSKKVDKPPVSIEESGEKTTASAQPMPADEKKEAESKPQSEISPVDPPATMPSTLQSAPDILNSTPEPIITPNPVPTSTPSVVLPAASTTSPLPPGPASPSPAPVSSVPIASPSSAPTSPSPTPSSPSSASSVPTSIASPGPTAIPPSPGVVPDSPEATSPPTQESKTGNLPKAEPSSSDVNPGTKQQPDSLKKEKAVARKRKK